LNIDEVIGRHNSQRDGASNCWAWPILWAHVRATVSFSAYSACRDQATSGSSPASLSKRRSPA